MAQGSTYVRYVGWRSPASICSAFPWSAVIRATPPFPRHGVDHPAQALVDRLDSAHRGRNRPRVPDHVGIGEVEDGESVLACAEERPRSGRSPRGQTSRACGHSWGRPAATAREFASRPATPSSRPPLKKYVTWAVLLRLRACVPGDAVLGENLGDGIGHLLLCEGDGDIEVFSVARHRRHVES